MKHRYVWMLGILLPVAALFGWGVGKVSRQAPSTHLTAAATQALAADGMTPVHKPAPTFHLINAQGHSVSLTQYRGKVVILTFWDPVCWLDCPVDAQEVVDMDRILGSKLATRVQIVAVDSNPQFHSTQDIQTFEKEHGLTSVSNFTYLTASSLRPLTRVWHAYYEYVHVPRYGMVQHSDVFWIINPQGQAVWLSNPSGHTKYIGGTAQLLATYVAQLLHQSLPTSAPAPAGLGNGVWWPIGLPYALVESPARQWMVAPYHGYRMVAQAATGTTAWRAVTPTAMTQRGGIEVAPVGTDSAWALLGGYGYQVDPVLRTTSDDGLHWHAPLIEPGPLPPWAQHPLAAISPTQAWLVSDHCLWHTQTQGLQWTSVSHQVPWLTRTSLCVSPGGRVWLAGDIRGTAQGALLWSYTSGEHGWHRITVPIPASWEHQPVLVMAPTWHSASVGGVAVVREDRNQEWLVWDTTTNGGKSWQRGSPALAVQGNPSTTTSMQGSVAYALSASGSVEEWAGGRQPWRRVTSHVPTGHPVALAVNPQGKMVLMVQTHTGLAIATEGSGGGWATHPLP